MFTESLKIKLICKNFKKRTPSPIHAFFRLLFIFNLGFKCWHRISLTKTLLVIAEREMSDFLNRMREPQKLCLPQALKKMTVHFSFSKKLEILCNISSVHYLTLAYGFDMPVNSCQTWVSRNQVEESNSYHRFLFGWW